MNLVTGYLLLTGIACFVFGAWKIRDNAIPSWVFFIIGWVAVFICLLISTYGRGEEKTQHQFRHFETPPSQTQEVPKLEKINAVRKTNSLLRGVWSQNVWR